jgi:hypothetical protein
MVADGFREQNYSGVELAAFWSFFHRRLRFVGLLVPTQTFWITVLVFASTCYHTINGNHTLKHKRNGGGGIRTRGDPEATPIFKTGAFNRSATPPLGRGFYSTRFSRVYWLDLRANVQ